MFSEIHIFHILDELVMGGMVLQTNMNEILARIEDQNKIQKAEAGISATAGASRAVSAMKNINLNGVKDKVFDIPSSIRDFKFWHRALAIESQIDPTSAFKLDYYQTGECGGSYTEIKGDLKKWKTKTAQAKLNLIINKIDNWDSIYVSKEQKIIRTHQNYIFMQKIYSFRLNKD